MAAVDIECEHRVFIAVIARPQAGERRVIVRINSDPSKVKRRAERGVSTCQAKTGVGIQISPFPPEPLVLCGEVVDIGKGNGNVLCAGKLLARSFQRVNMCRIMRPLTAFIISIVAFERFQHGVIFCRAANNAVLHIVLEHIVGADIRCPRLCAVIAFAQLGRIILLDQSFSFCFTALIVFVGSVVKISVDQLVRISRRYRCIEFRLTFGSRSRSIHIERIQKRLCRRPCRFIGVPCDSGTVVCADRCACRIAQLSLLPAPCGIDSLIKCSRVGLRNRNEFCYGVVEILSCGINCILIDRCTICHSLCRLQIGHHIIPETFGAYFFSIKTVIGMIILCCIFSSDF